MKQGGANQAFQATLASAPKRRRYVAPGSRHTSLFCKQGLRDTIDRTVMHITRVDFHRFKRFDDTKTPLRPGVALLAGSNDSGTSSILQGLAVWESCRTVLEIERGRFALSADAKNQGDGSRRVDEPVGHRRTSRDRRML